jgi:sugar lactone lactonase YvrE
MLRLCGLAGFTVVGGSWLAACTSSSSTSSGTTTSPPTTATPFTGYGPLGPVDANGLRVPAGFSSRVVATSGEVVANTDYLWPIFPDGGATFAARDGGWIYVANSEVSDKGGGVSMVQFDRDGTIVDARAIATGTSRNCAGGATPWDTWLTCEEVPTGIVYECDPTGAASAVALPALGAFNHEAVAVDPVQETLYLTEDELTGGLYRFTPAAYPDLSNGSLEIMTERGGAIGWAAVPDPSGATTPTREQVADTKVFVGGEGICYLDGSVYFTTKGDNSVRRYDPATNTLTVVYDAATSSTPALTGVDNIVGTPAGQLYVAEDGGDMQIVMLHGEEAEAVVQVTGVENSEMTGPAFSPDGSRLYFSSQRNPGRTYEVTGPWRTT